MSNDKKVTLSIDEYNHLLGENLVKQEKLDGIRPSKFLATAIPINSQSNDAIGVILEELKKSSDSAAIKKLSLDARPNDGNYSAIYKRRNTLVPPEILKQLRDTEELIGGIILPARARQLVMFSRPRANRFDVGFTVDLKPEAYKDLSEKEQEELKATAVPKLREWLLNCGSTEGVPDKDRRTLGQFFMETIEDVLLFGWFTVEFRKDEDGNYHSFRPNDAGTIYEIIPGKGDDPEAAKIRAAVVPILEKLQGKKVDVSKWSNDVYQWVQVIDGIPQQVFTDDELIVMNMNPSTDIRRNGYPVSPVERIITAITTHINLTTHNKMYFINGRAARNVMTFQSENLEPADVEAIRAQMAAHINSANASWRMPVFGMGVNDKVTIMPMDASGRDMEFQYLADLNKRMIFAAFQMSPDEVAALGYLSKGTNSQALAESSNAWKLTEAKNLGMRPLLMLYEDFFNERLLPKLNPTWAKYLRIDLSGLDSDTPEKEASRLGQDANLHMTMNEILERVEKDPVNLGGDFPLNPSFMATMEKYFTKGQILKAYGGKGFENADQDPNLSYCLQDPTSIQLFMSQKQQQMMAQNPQFAQQQGGEQEEKSEDGDLDSAIAQLQQTLSKSERNLPANRKLLLKQHKAARSKILKEFEQDSKNMIETIMNALTGKKNDHGHDH